MHLPQPVGRRRSRWGEGPVWTGDRLFYVDIEGKSIIRYNPSSGREKVWHFEQRIGFVAPCESGRLLYGGDLGLFFFDLKSGLSTPIHDPEPKRNNNRFNDGKCSPEGRLFAGTIAMDKTPGAARLYRLDQDHACAIAFGPVTNSNGLAWSLDGQTLYYIDTPRQAVTAFDYDPDSGHLDNPREVINTEKFEGSPDGMCIDCDGMLWVAMCHGGEVIRFDPATGRDLQHLAVPARETTSCTFAGNDLYVTTGIPPAFPEPDAGSLFVFRDLQVSAPPAHLFTDGRGTT